MSLHIIWLNTLVIYTTVCWQDSSLPNLKIKTFSWEASATTSGQSASQLFFTKDEKPRSFQELWINLELSWSGLPQTLMEKFVWTPVFTRKKTTSEVKIYLFNDWLIQEIKQFQTSTNLTWLEKRVWSQTAGKGLIVSQTKVHSKLLSCTVL